MISHLAPFRMALTILNATISLVVRGSICIPSGFRRLSKGVGGRFALRSGARLVPVAAGASNCVMAAGPAYRWWVRTACSVAGVGKVRIVALIGSGASCGCGSAALPV